MHTMQLRVATLEVDRNNMAASKLDLAQEVVKLKRRYEEADDQVKKLNRNLERKQQQLAEIGVSAKRSSIAEAGSRRNSAVAATSAKARSSFSASGKWTQ
jgi:chromosome segregation ATPase